jgi:hypothetical protein
MQFIHVFMCFSHGPNPLVFMVFVAAMSVLPLHRPHRYQRRRDGCGHRLCHRDGHGSAKSVGFYMCFLKNTYGNWKLIRSSKLIQKRTRAPDTQN